MGEMIVRQATTQMEQTNKQKKSVKQAVNVLHFQTYVHNVLIFAHTTV